MKLKSFPFIAAVVATAVGFNSVISSGISSGLPSGIPQNFLAPASPAAIEKTAHSVPRPDPVELKARYAEDPEKESRRQEIKDIAHLVQYVLVFFAGIYFYFSLAPSIAPWWNEFWRAGSHEKKAILIYTLAVAGIAFMIDLFVGSDEGRTPAVFIAYFALFFVILWLSLPIMAVSLFIALTIVSAHHVHHQAQKLRILPFAEMLKSAEWVRWKGEIAEKSRFDAWRAEHSQIDLYLSGDKKNWGAAYYYAGNALLALEEELKNVLNKDTTPPDLDDIIQFLDSIADEHISSLRELAIYLRLLKAYYALKVRRFAESEAELQRIAQLLRSQTNLQVGEQAGNLARRAGKSLMKELQTLRPAVEASL